MAVEIKYIVVRDGVEKMTFTSKKEADAYDKQLDIAENLLELMQGSELGIDEDKLDTLAFFLAQNATDAVAILKGGSPKAKDAAKKNNEPTPKQGGGSNDESTKAPVARAKGKAA